MVFRGCEPFSWSLVSIAWILAISSRAQGADGGDDIATREARARFQEGVVLHDRGDCEGAIAKFSQAYALRPHPDVLFNLGVTHRACGHPVEAKRAFASYLDDAGHVPPERRRVAEQGIAEVSMASENVTTTSASMESVAPKREERPAPHGEVAALAGFATGDLNLGFGLRGGLFVMPRLWLGGTVVFQLGATASYQAAAAARPLGQVGPGGVYEVSTSMFYAGPEAGYELAIDRFLLRPYLGVGVGRFSSSTNLTGDVSHSTERLLLWPGAVTTFEIPGTSAFAGADLRLITVPGGPALSVLAMGGVHL